jgi:hypothetical protein
MRRNHTKLKDCDELPMSSQDPRRTAERVLDLPGICRILRLVTASAETWKSYAQLLLRLSPSISHILFASPDGTCWWSSDPDGASRVQYALSLLLKSHATRHRDIDGLIETTDRAESRYGFRVRGGLGEVLGIVIIALPEPEARHSLAAVHSAIKPALDCLQSELSARATASIAIGELHENLAGQQPRTGLCFNSCPRRPPTAWNPWRHIPTLANQHLLRAWSRRSSCRSGI